MAREDWITVRSIDAGGQGRTLEVRNKTSDQTGVLKLLHSNRGKRGIKARARMLREVTALRIVGAQGGRVPQVLDAYVSDLESDKEFFFVMDLVEGEVLSRYVKSADPIALEAAIGIVKSLASTISIAHENDIVHRDIKPKNIIVGKHGVEDVWLLDFGLSASNEDASDTEVGEQVGNRFMALPEGQAIGGENRDPRSDTTQLVGLLLYLLNGGVEPRVLLDQDELPPHRRSATAARNLGHQNQNLAIRAIFDKGFAQRLSQRFQSIDEFIQRANLVITAPSADEVNLEELAKLSSQALHDADAALQTKISLERAKKVAEALRNSVAGQLGKKIQLSDFEVSVNTSTSGGLNLPPNLLEISYLTVHVVHVHSGARYAIQYAFQSVDGAEIGVLCKAHLWQSEAEWSSPILWFRESTTDHTNWLVKDARSRIAQGIAATTNQRMSGEEYQGDG